MAVRVPAAKIGAVLQAGNALQKKALLDLVHDEIMHAPRFVARAIRDTKPFQPVDRGIYAASTKTDLTAKGGMVYNDAPHAAVIEYGARPFWPPLAPLYWWAYRKFRVQLQQRHRQLALSPRRRGEHKRLSAQKYRAWEALKIARALQRAIARRGIAPRHVFARATVAMQASLGRALRGLRRHPAFRGTP